MVDTSIYSGSKALWHLDNIRDLRDGVHIVPRHVQLIISDLCNQDCSFCAYRMSGGFSTQNFSEGDKKNPNRKIPTEKCIEILSDCAQLGVKAVQFTGGGEPTVHLDHLEIFSKAQELGLQTALVTNGTRIYDTDIYGKMVWIRVSLDSGTKETYEKVRKSKLWEQALKGIEKLSNLNGPVVGVGFVITEDNWKEIYKACALVKSLGVPYIRLTAMFSSMGSLYYQWIYNDIVEDIKYAKSLEDDTFKVVDLFTHRIQDLNLGTPKHSYCGYQRFTTYIGGDQKIYRCCTTSYTDLGEIGDLTNQTFLHWWKNEAEVKYYDFDAHNCHHCQFNEQNEAIHRQVKEEPLHGDFV